MTFKAKLPAKKLSVRIVTQVTPGMWADIKRLADQNGLSVHTWFRMVLTHEVRRDAARKAAGLDIGDIAATPPGAALDDAAATHAATDTADAIQGDPDGLGDERREPIRKNPWHDAPPHNL